MAEETVHAARYLSTKSAHVSAFDFANLANCSSADSVGCGQATATSSLMTCHLVAAVTGVCAAKKLRTVAASPTKAVLKAACETKCGSTCRRPDARDVRPVSGPLHVRLPRQRRSP